MREWYVFDKYDCFGSYETAAAAAQKAEQSAFCEFEGIHILYLTKEEFDAYCTTNKFPHSSLKCK